MIEMIKKQPRTNRRGFVLMLATVMVLLLSIVGFGLLRLGFENRMMAIRTTTQISARAAADAGITKAIFEMNKNVTPWRFNNITTPANMVLPSTNANYTYTIEEITKNSDYRITAIGRSGQAIKTVSVNVRSQGLFDYAIYATGDAHHKHPKQSPRPKPPKKGGKIEIERYVVEGYNSSDPSTFSGDVQVRTNSNHKKSVKLKDNVTINGDMVVGSGKHRPDQVIEMKSSASITGDTYASPELWEAPPVIVPQGLVSGQLKDYKHKDDKPLSGNVKYSEFKLPKNKVQEIKGDVTMYVEGDMKLEKDSELIIPEGSSLTLYLGKKLEVKKDSADDTIKGLLNLTKDPTKLIIYGTDTCEKIKIEENRGTFYGAVYAPYAKVEIKNSNDIYGALVGWDVKLKNKKEYGIGTLYYDEALSSINYFETMGSDDPQRFVMKNWREQ